MDDYSIFIILLISSAFIHHFYENDTHCTPSSGNIVMAIGIITYDVLPQFSWISPLLRHLVTLELFIIWLYLVGFFIKCTLKTQFHPNAPNQFGIGTWIAGSAVLALLFLREYPHWVFVIWASSLTALSTWPIYLILSGMNLWRIFLKKIKVHTGTILLLTVSTQSIVLLTHSLWAPPIILSTLLIIFGLMLYLMSILIVGSYWVKQRKKRLFLGWSNGNSIMHGALSISGLASSVTHAFADSTLWLFWNALSLLFVFVETMGLIKMYYRIKIAGLFSGLCVYRQSQWTRIFTFGMYYSFSLSLSEHHFILYYVLTYGKYIVLMLLLFEVYVFFQHQFRNYRIS